MQLAHVRDVDGMVTGVSDDTTWTIALDGKTAIGLGSYEVRIKGMADDEPSQIVQTEVRLDVNPGCTLVAIPEGVTPSLGWKWDGEEFSLPAPVFTQEMLIERAAQKRWERENTSILLDGFPVATDDRSKVLIMGARMRADLALRQDPPGDVVEQWASPFGNVQLHAVDLVAISNALAHHVSVIFAKYAEVELAIANGSITTYDEVDEAFLAVSLVYNTPA